MQTAWFPLRGSTLITGLYSTYLDSSSYGGFAPVRGQRLGLTCALCPKGVPHLSQAKDKAAAAAKDGDPIQERLEHPMLCSWWGPLAKLVWFRLIFHRGVVRLTAIVTYFTVTIGSVKITNLSLGDPACMSNIVQQLGLEHL